MLPGSQAVLFSAYGATNPDDANIDVISMKTGGRKIVRKGGYSPHYAATSHRAGYLLYLHKNTMFAAPFDSASLNVTGPSIPVLEEVSSDTAAGGNFALSASGTLVFKSGKDDRATSNRSMLSSDQTLRCASRPTANGWLLPWAGPGEIPASG